MLSAATWCVCARTTQVFSVHQGAYCLSPLLPFLERFLSYHQQLDWSAALWRCSWLLWVDTGGSGQNGRGGYWDAKGGRGFWVKGLIDWSSPVHLLCVYQSAWWSQCPSLNNAWLLPPPPFSHPGWMSVCDDIRGGKQTAPSCLCYWKGGVSCIIGCWYHVLFILEVINFLLSLKAGLKSENGHKHT